ncbi:MAG: MBL fold metallo-hydrolase [Proteobacteria bacterium]|nr:MBL fold metallo-hydrolase [Pseudomonadota bacterium]
MPYGFRISPAWWPALAVLSPILVPLTLARWRSFVAGQKDVEMLNSRRMAEAEKLDLPGLKSMELTVVVEEEHDEGFVGEAGVSYLLRTDKGSLLMDIGFGEEQKAFAHNCERLGLTMKDVDAILVSHLHLDHMGGLKAQRARKLGLPAGFGAGEGKPCYVPDSCEAEGFVVHQVQKPMMLECGLATTGPLARMLFFFGQMEEQAVIAHIEGKGLVVLTGCGHPTIQVILAMARSLSDEPIYAVGGGLHFPITRSRGSKLGIEMQQIFGTGKPLWQSIGDDDLDQTIQTLNQAGPKRLLLSPHDSCDYAVSRLTNEVNAEVEVLRAGAKYDL